MLLSVFLFFAYQDKVDAIGKIDFAGRVTVVIPMATCSNVYTCGACALCGCGAWDQVIIAPMFGKTMDSMGSYYVCRMPSYMPAPLKGNANFMMGSTVKGYCQTPYLSAYSIFCNIWSVWQ